MPVAWYVFSLLREQCGTDHGRTQDKSQGRFGEIRGGVVTLMTEAQASYCGSVTVSPGGNSKVSGVEI